MSVPLAELGAVVECLAAMSAEGELAELLERELRHPEKGRLEEEFAEWCRAPREGEPPYQFVMGSPEKEKDRDGDEAQVPVVLTQALWVRPISVTYGQWLIMAEAPDYRDRTSRAARLPVTDVSWFEASLYARWLEHWRRHHALAFGGAPAEYRVSLPSEAQREFFTRAGTTTRFWQGDSDADLEAVGWFAANSNNPHRVPGKRANWWGLHDVHGNVWEWCRDWYAEERNGGKDPLGPPTGLGRVLRGGSFSDEAKECRSASRALCEPDLDLDDLGFRLVLSAPECTS